MLDTVQKQPPELSIKKVCLKISQYSQENNCDRVSFYTVNNKDTGTISQSGLFSLLLTMNNFLYCNAFIVDFDIEDRSKYL